MGVSYQFTRCYLTCFNVDPEFASAFKFPKSRGGGFFTIKYMDAGFDKEAEMGEFFIEFNEKVWGHKLTEELEKAGATQVYITTFTNNDGNESAANALLRVWSVAERTGHGFKAGECQEALLAKTQAKLAESKKKPDTAELDEKTSAAIKQSLAEIETVKFKVEGVDGKVDTIQEGVCQIIPDLKAENEKLKKSIKDLVLSRDQQEYKTGIATARINVEIEKADKLGVENLGLRAENARLKDQVKSLQDQLNLAEAVKQVFSLEFQLKRVGERLDENERELKRARQD